MTLRSQSDEFAFMDRYSQVNLRLRDLTFDEAVRQYRDVEAEFITRSGNEENDVRDIQRRITRWILIAAQGNEESFEVCRAIWEDLQKLGFEDLERRCTFSGIYARCCQMNGEFDAGLEIIEPLIPELERGIDDPTIGSEMQAHCRQLLPAFHEIRDELRAGLREPPEPPET